MVVNAVVQKSFKVRFADAYVAFHFLYEVGGK
jgi:hypothetical protein